MQNPKNARKCITKTKSNKVHLLALAIGLGLGTSASAFADQPAPNVFGNEDQPQSNEATEKSAAVTLDNVTVTAQRRVQRAKDVPLTISALSEQSLKESGVSSIFDLRTAVSGLSFGGAGNMSQPAIRGVSTNVSVGGAENSNALYVDGVFYSQPHFFGTNMPDVERVEVLKGPQGTLFGRNSVGGAVRIFTRGPNLESSTGDFSVDMGYHTGGEGSRSGSHHAVKAFFSTPLITDKLAFSVSAAHEYAPGWMTDDRTGDRTAPHERSNARFKLLFQPSEKFNALINAFYLKHDDRAVQAMTPLNGLSAASHYPGSIVSSRPFHYSFDTSGGIEWDPADVENHGVALTLEWQLAAGTLTSTSNSSKDSWYGRPSLHQATASMQCLQAFACIHLDRGSEGKIFSQELNFSSKDYGRFSYVTGLFYYTSTREEFSYLNGGVNPSNPQGTLSYLQEFNLDSAAVYGEVQFKATDRLTATLGGRYTREQRNDHILAPRPISREVDFSSFLPKVSLLYKLTDTTNAYFTYTVGEASGLSGISNSASVPAYLEVKPEKNTAYEFGVKHATPNASINAALFYYDYQDKQEQVGAVSTAAATYHLNTGPVRIYGVDLDTNYRINDNFSLRSALSWIPVAKYLDFPYAVGISTDRRPNGQFQQIFFDATGKRLIRSPKITASLTAAYDRGIRNGNLDASATLHHTSKQYQDGYHVIVDDGFTTLSARLGYTFSNNVRLGLYGKNLTNEVYIQHAFASALGFTVNYAQPREVGISASYSF